MATLTDTLLLLNPWWTNGQISTALALPYRRPVFRDIQRLLLYRQLVILSGLRRVGKTTLLYQIIEELLKKTPQAHILYYSWDKQVADPTDVLDAYQNLTGVDWKKERVFVFMDEITQLDDWAQKVKTLYDAVPTMKLLLSSSSSIRLEEEAIEILGGRYFLRAVPPLSFTEYLELVGKGQLRENPNLHAAALQRESRTYLLRTFPEIVGWTDELHVKDYLRSTVIDKIVRSDLPERFAHVNRELLSTLLETVYQAPGIYIDYDSLSQKLRISKKTLSRHVRYLESAYLLRRLRNFRVSTLTSSRKLQRLYPYWWTLACPYNPPEDKLWESVVVSSADAAYYWRKNGKEIDVLLVEGKEMLPVEVKHKAEVTKKDLRHLRYFMEKQRVKSATVVYNGTERRVTDAKGTIAFLPLWKWLLAGRARHQER